MFVGGTSEHWGPGVYRSDDLGRTWTETQGAAVRFPEDLGSSVERVWQIQPRPAGAGCGLRRDAAVGPVPVRGRRGVLRAGPFALGPPAPARVGRRFRRSGDPHDRAAPRPTRSGSRWPCRPAASIAPTTAARSLEPGQHAASRPTSSPTRGPSSASACTRWPRTRPARADVRAEPPRRLPLRRRRDHWASIADGLPADFGFPILVHPQRAGDRVRLPAGRRRRADPAERARPGSGGPPTPGRPGRPSAARPAGRLLRRR